MLHNIPAQNHPLDHHNVLKEPPHEKKEKKEAQIHCYISLKMLGYFRGIIPPHTQQNKTPLYSH